MPVTDTLIWAAVVLVPVMTVVLWLTPALYRAIESWIAAHATDSAERGAGVQVTLADVDERRHELAVRRGLLAEETAAKRAQLLAETAEYDTDREAAGKVLDAAEAARREVLAARAEAEAALAPEMARKALEGTAGEDMASLSEAYAAYCNAALGTPWSFGQWIGNFRGLGS